MKPAARQSANLSQLELAAHLIDATPEQSAGACYFEAPTVTGAAPRRRDGGPRQRLTMRARRVPSMDLSCSSRSASKCRSTSKSTTT